MYIDPIHAGSVALAHAFTLAARAPAQPPRRLAHWWQKPGKVECPTPDPVQLMLWSECAGRSYATALSGLLLMNQLRRNRAVAPGIDR